MMLMESKEELWWSITLRCLTAGMWKKTALSRYFSCPAKDMSWYAHLWKIYTNINNRYTPIWSTHHDIFFVSCYLWDIFFTHRHVVRDSIQGWPLENPALGSPIDVGIWMFVADIGLFLLCIHIALSSWLHFLFLPVAMFGNATSSLIGCGPQTTNVCPRGGKSWLLPLINSAGYFMHAILFGISCESNNSLW